MGDNSSMSGEGEAVEAAPERKEIYSYKAPWPIYGMNWSHKVREEGTKEDGDREGECVCRCCLGRGHHVRSLCISVSLLSSFRSMVSHSNIALVLAPSEVVLC